MAYSGGTMKLLAINGSHKKANGINQLLIDHLFKGAKEVGAECETIRLSEFNINRCIACEYCQNQKDYLCVYDDKDDFIKIIERIKQADILIFATPIYLFQISSLMKIFLERYHSRGKSKVRIVTQSHLIFHDFEPKLGTKPFVSIIVSDNIERATTENANFYFNTFSKFMDAPRVGNIIRNGSIMFKNLNIISQRIIENILKNLEIAGIELVKTGHISRKTGSKINVSILPIPSLLFNIMKRTKIGKLKIMEKIN